MNYFRKAFEILKRDGLIQLCMSGFPYLYNQHVASSISILPRASVNLNGVDVNVKNYNPKLFPCENKHIPDYESGIVSGIEKHVQIGDKVVVVGGGWGVTTVKAAQQVGETGEVIVYEGSVKEAEYVQDTVEKNNVSEIVTINHCIVGPKVSLRGMEGEASYKSPEDLPECDVLELDCEGAEVDILEKMDIQPRVILVETHGVYDAPSSEVEDILQSQSYTIESKEIAEKRLKELHIEQDVHVLSALRQ